MRQRHRGTPQRPRPPEITIEKLDADSYVDLRTGEVKEFQHTASRAEDKASVAQSLRNLRDIINANLTDPETALWVTLTYRENMRDPQRLYEDYHAFIKRFRRYLKKHGHPPVEYIAAAEPQGRGAWHLHVLLLFSEKAPFIPNAHMAKLWGQGHTKTKSLKGVDNPGLYLTAYLGDMELAEAAMSGATRGRLGEVETVDEHGQRQKKAIIKGARLHLYPPRVQPLPLLPWREAAPGHADGRVEGPGDHRGRTLDLRKDHSRDRRPGPDLEHHKLPPV